MSQGGQTHVSLDNIYVNLRPDQDHGDQPVPMITRRAAPNATASGWPPSFSLPPSPATLKFPQKPQECREKSVSLHHRNQLT